MPRTDDLFPDRPISPEELHVFTRRALNLTRYMVVHTERRTVRAVEERDVVYMVDAVDEREATDLPMKGEYVSCDEGRWEWVEDDAEDDGEITNVEVVEWKD